MFSSTADLYDVVYGSFKDYGAEATKVAALIRGALPNAASVLDVACGTGEHARLLSERAGFSVDGLDLDRDMVGIAQSKNPSGRFTVGDMTEFELGRTYDVVLCLFSSIGYLRTLENVVSALSAFRRHLAPGGVVIVEPWFQPSEIQSPTVRQMIVEQAGLVVVRMSHMVRDDRISRLRFDYLVGRPEGIEHFSEMHEMGLFTVAEMLDCFAAAGLEVSHDPVGLIGRGLYVGRNRNDGSS